jgi:hypothetical protein
VTPAEFERALTGLSAGELEHLGLLLRDRAARLRQQEWEEQRATSADPEAMGAPAHPDLERIALIDLWESAARDMASGRSVIGLDWMAFTLKEVADCVPKAAVRSGLTEDEAIEAFTVGVMRAALEAKHE